MPLVLFILVILLVILLVVLVVLVVAGCVQAAFRAKAQQRFI